MVGIICVVCLSRSSCKRLTDVCLEGNTCKSKPGVYMAGVRETLDLRLRRRSVEVGRVREPRGGRGEQSTPEHPRAPQSTAEL